MKLALTIAGYDSGGRQAGAIKHSMGIGHGVGPPTIFGI